jgi:acetyl esterase/lipase
LDEAGVPVTIQTYNGFIHDYGLLNPLDHIEAVKFSSEQAALGLRKALFLNKIKTPVFAGVFLFY